MRYAELKKQYQDEINGFPMFFAFSNEQFNEGMKGLDVQDTSKLVSIGAGGYMRKTDVAAFRALLDKHNAGIKTALESREFLIDALVYELNNHEYCITYDAEPALNTLGVSLENDMQQECFKTACDRVLQSACCF